VVAAVDGVEAGFDEVREDFVRDERLVHCVLSEREVQYLEVVVDDVLDGGRTLAASCLDEGSQVEEGMPGTIPSSSGILMYSTSSRLPKRVR